MRLVRSIVICLAAGLVLAGCGSGRATTVTVTNAASASTQPTTGSTPAASTTATAPSQAPSYPMVHFTITNNGTHPVGMWPFTAQFSGITESPNGFTGSDPVPPQDTYLMVRVAITSQIIGRTIGVMPQPAVQCHGPNDHTWSYQGNDGYDQGSETDPDPEGTSIDLGDGQSYLWDSQWQVPEGTSTTSVKCILEDVTHYPLYSGHVIGSGDLN